MTTITPHPDAHARSSRDRRVSRPLLIGMGCAVLVVALVAAWLLRPIPDSDSGPIALAERDRPSGQQAALNGGTLEIPPHAGLPGVRLRMPAGRVIGDGSSILEDGSRHASLMAADKSVTFLLVDFPTFDESPLENLKLMADRTSKEHGGAFACGKPWSTSIAGKRAAGAVCDIGKKALHEYRVMHDGRLYGLGILLSDRTDQTAIDTGLAVLQTWEWIE